MTKLFSRSSVVQASLDNTKGLNKGITQSQNTHVHTYINTQWYSFCDIWTASPQGVQTTVQSGSFQASNIYFQRGMIFPEALYPIKAFFSPQLSTFDGSVQECNLAVTEKFTGRQWRPTKPKYVAGRNTRTSLGLKIPEGQRVTALGKGKKKKSHWPVLAQVTFIF